MSELMQDRAIVTIEDKGTSLNDLEVTILFNVK